MIDKTTIKDKEAFDLLKDALNEITLRFPLCGLSYMGEAVVVKEANVPTMATDGRNVFYGSKWVKSNGHRGNIFDLVHEWMHIFLNHPMRKGDRDPGLWGIAIDMVVVHQTSTVLSSPGDTWEPPSDGVIPEEWSKNMTAEDIYDELLKRGYQPPKRTGLPIRDATDIIYETPHTFTEHEEEEFRQKFSSELAQAALIQHQIHGRDATALYGEVIGSRLEEILKGKVPWGRLLKGNILADIGHEVPTWAPPKRKYYPKLILPQYKSPKVKKVIIAVDVSASVGETLMKAFIANVVPAAKRAAEIYVITFDAIVRECVRTTRPEKILKDVKYMTGAHTYTSVVGVFEKVEKINPSSIVILTDGFVILPDKSYHNTLWVIPQNGRKQPWGKTHVMDIAW